MPRLSPEARAALERNKPPPLKPSPHLSLAEKKAWRALVAATAAGHLSERDRPLLESFVTLAVAQRTLQALVAGATAEQLLAGKALGRVETIGRALAALSNRLKISPLADHSEPHRAAIRKDPGQGKTRGLVRVQ